MKALPCPYCGPALPSDLEELRRHGTLTRRHAHRLFVVLTGTSWRFWWGTGQKVVHEDLVRRRYGQDAHRLKIRPATYADVVRQHEAGGVR